MVSVYNILNISNQKLFNIINNKIYEIRETDRNYVMLINMWGRIFWNCCKYLVGLFPTCGDT